MTVFRLTKLAEEDLVSIAAYGDEVYGEDRSDAYREQLKKRFELISEKPLLFPAVDHIRAGYRRSVCGVHSIYYRIENEGVVIVRILGRQETSKALQG